MGDLTSKRAILAKGWMFLAIAGMSAGLLIAQSPKLLTAILVGVLVWSSCRFYYFLFYVLEKYVDPAMKYRGLWHVYSQTRRARSQVSKTARGE